MYGYRASNILKNSNTAVYVYNSTDLSIAWLPIPTESSLSELNSATEVSTSIIPTNNWFICSFRPESVLDIHTILCLVCLLFNISFFLNMKFDLYVIFFNRNDFSIVFLENVRTLNSHLFVNILLKFSLNK